MWRILLTWHRGHTVVVTYPTQWTLWKNVRAWKFPTKRYKKNCSLVVSFLRNCVTKSKFQCFLFLNYHKKALVLKGSREFSWSCFSYSCTVHENWVRCSFSFQMILPFFVVYMDYMDFLAAYRLHSFLFYCITKIARIFLLAYSDIKQQRIQEDLERLATSTKES